MDENTKVVIDFEEFAKGCPRHRQDPYEVKWFGRNPEKVKGDPAWHCCKNMHPFDDVVETDCTGTPLCLERNCELFYGLNFLYNLLKPQKTGMGKGD